MSASGKVSLLGIYTRLQSIKDKHLRMDKEIFWYEQEVKPGSVHGERACLLGIIDHLGAALEESRKLGNEETGTLRAQLVESQLAQERAEKRMEQSHRDAVDARVKQEEAKDMLEESQRQVRIKSEEIEIRKGNVKVVTAELVEAQQTIARQKEGLKFYASGAHVELNAVNEMVSVEDGCKARAALGNKEGSDNQL